MDIIQVVIIGMIGTILTITVKQYKPELAALLALATGILILFFGFSALQSALDRVFAIAKPLTISTRRISERLYALSQSLISASLRRRCAVTADRARLRLKSSFAQRY